MDEDTDTNARYMGEMFPTLDNDVISNILARNRNNLEHSMDEALSVVAIEEERKNIPRSAVPSSEPPPAVATAPSEAPRVPALPDEFDSRGFFSVLAKPKSQGRGSLMELPPEFLAVPSTRLVVDEVRRGFTDYTFHVHKHQSSKIGITLCRADGCIALYSVNPALMRVNDASSSIVAMKPGDILFGINQEFFCDETSIDDVSYVLSSSGRYVSLHLRRISPCSVHLSIKNIQEHIMVKLILQAYKSSPPGFTVGFSEVLGRILQDISMWGEGYVLQIIPNKVLHRDLTDLSNEAALISRVFRGHGCDDDVAMPPARRNVVMRSAVSAMSMAPYIGLQGNEKGNVYTSMNSRGGDSALAALALPGVKLTMVKQNWCQRVKVNVKQFRPALNVRILKVVKHRNNGFVEYVICVLDVLSGYEWTLSKGYTDFSDLKKVFACIILLFVVKKIIFSCNLQEIFDASPELFNHLPLISKTDNLIVHNFLKCLVSILETSIFSQEVLSVYQAFMSFLAIPEKLAHINKLMERQSLAMELQRGIEALVHCVLQTPQLRQLVTLATNSCSR